MPPMATRPPAPAEVSERALWLTAARTMTAPETTTWRGLAGELDPTAGPMRASVVPDVMARASLPAPPAIPTEAARTSTVTAVVADASTVSELALTPVFEPTAAVVSALCVAYAKRATVETRTRRRRWSAPWWS